MDADWADVWAGRDLRTYRDGKLRATPTVFYCAAREWWSGWRTKPHYSLPGRIKMTSENRKKRFEVGVGWNILPSPTKDAYFRVKLKNTFKEILVPLAILRTQDFQDASAQTRRRY